MRVRKSLNGTGNNMQDLLSGIKQDLMTMDFDQRIAAINDIKMQLHEISPFKSEPVDCVIWVKNNTVMANDYNPNSVAPPEMKLLQKSIQEDGYTQPIVSWFHDENNEVIDGFHRHRVGKECKDIQSRIHGYLPIVRINSDRQEKGDRIASTIRHNRARGKHRIEAMSDIVIELKRRNWSDKKIADNLGMDQDEVLRLCQITGLIDVFSDAEFSTAWDAVIMQEEELQHIDESDIEMINQPDNTRIFHEWNKWECYPAGFYSDKPPVGLTVSDCEQSYASFLADLDAFGSALERVITEWPMSCEHYLTNERMNRIAWLGQASMCLENGVPSRFCGGYNLLSDDQKLAADMKALEYLNKWLIKNERQELDLESAGSKTESNLY